MAAAEAGSGDVHSRRGKQQDNCGGRCRSIHNRRYVLAEAASVWSPAAGSISYDGTAEHMIPRRWGAAAAGVGAAVG